MDELGIARAIAAGEMSSPQQYENLWLFAIRITGTGAAYRAGLKEYCWREPAHYLTDEFLARCNGLAVVFEHPEEVSMLNSEEFAKRIVGTVMLPYFKGDEVWGVAKIYDEATAALMQQEQLSTSPAVVFREASSTNETLTLGDGSKLLIEGKPALLDHIAICEQGVWDKGGDPAGVDSTGVVSMTDEEKAAEEKARADANAKLDNIAAHLTNLTGRMDAYDTARKDAEDKKKEEEEREKKEREDSARRDSRLDAARKDRFGARKDGEGDEDFKKRFDADESAMCDALRKDGEPDDWAKDAASKARKDAEEECEREDKARKDAKARADKARKDEDEKEEKEKKERDDKARKDSTMSSDMMAQIKALQAQIAEMNRETSPEERDALASAQSRADGVAAMFGDRVPAPLPGESALAYRRKLAARFQRHSPRYKDAKLDTYDALSIGAAEDAIYADAVQASRNTASETPGLLLAEHKFDEAGRRITTWHGDPMSWMQHFMTGGQVGKIIRPNTR